MSVSCFRFGPFELDPVRLELRRDAVRLNVGARACRVLLVLIERAGQVVSQADLLSSAWPGLHVEDVNLRVHIVALRKALASGGEPSIDITTVPRQGYVFAAPVAVVGTAETLAPARAPRRLNPLIGRSQALVQLGEELAIHRIVTIVGAGGMGKTALALAAVAEAAGGESGECVFVDFSTCVSALHVAQRTFEALELEGTPHDVAAHIVRALAHRTILLVFDNCEHVVGEVAAMVAALTSRADGVSILATSREPLRVPGERVFPLEPLGCSAKGAVLTASSAMDYPAIRMFVEAAGLRSRAFVIDDANASMVGEVCRRLDGIPLALELAAATSDTMTIVELSRQLDDRFTVLTRGARTALPRHRTLQAALDWSYDALSRDEALVMRRLGVFPGRFTAADAQEIAAVGALSRPAVHGLLADLAAKSLINVDVGQETATFRFLETMRVYARLKLLESDEANEVYTRYVAHTLDRLAWINRRESSPADMKRLHGAVLDDWRAAHDWATRTGDGRTALALMEVAIGLCRSLNIKSEYIDRAAGTLRAVPADGGDEEAWRLEMRVCDHKAQMLIDTQPRGATPFTDRIETIALRSLELSRLLRTVDYEMSALVTLTVAAQTAAHREKLLLYVSKTDEFAQRSGRADFVRTASYLNGYARYHCADFEAALHELDRALVGAPPLAPGAPAAFDHVPSVRVFRSRTLWARGEFRASLEEMEEAHRSAIEGGHVPTIAWVAWGGGVCVYMWAGALERAAASAKLHEDLAREYSNPGWASYLPSVRVAIDKLGDGGGSFGAGPIDWTPHVPSQADVMTSIHCAFHRPADLQRMEATPRHWCAAEHFRAAGEHHLAAGRTQEAEAWFSQALATAKGQGAAAWEIRATLSLARLRLRQSQVAAARALLEPLVDRFPDGRLNADLVQAAETLAAC